MSPAPVTAAAAAEIAAAQAQLVGPDPSVIQVAKPYLFEQTIEDCLRKIGTHAVKEDSFRLQGVAWIENVRRALQL
jgi:CTD kinase subunit beta